MPQVSSSRIPGWLRAKDGFGVGRESQVRQIVVPGIILQLVRPYILTWGIQIQWALTLITGRPMEGFIELVQTGR
jgi:hypothetical protein